MKKTMLASAISALALTTLVPVAAHSYEISASAAAASTYLWRGQDLGGAAVSGDLTISEGGAYATLWASSGDSASGHEYDLGLGYGGSVDDFSYDISYWSYMYQGLDAGLGDVAEIIASVGYGPVSGAVYYDVSNWSDDKDVSYYTLSAAAGDFSATVGQFKTGEYTHLDLGYGYNDNIGFTLSIPVSQDEDELGELTTDPVFVVSYSVPIE